MLMKLLGALCAIAATGTVLVYGFGLQVQRPIAPLQAKQEAPLTTPKTPEVASSAPIHAPAATQPPALEPPTSQATLADISAAAEITVAAEPATAEPAAIKVSKPMAQVLVAEAEAEVELETIDQSLEKSVAESVAPPVEPSVEQVFVFWQPFRSRGSAQGFAKGLSARAQVPINVISEDTDAGRHYRVVLPFADETQRLERLAKLESATRLEMGE